MNPPTRWTHEMRQRLRKRYPECVSVKALAEEMGVSVQAIYCQVQRLKLSSRRKQYHYWTQAEDDRLVKEYPDCESVKRLAREMGVSTASVYNRVKLLDVQRRKQISSSKVLCERIHTLLLRGLSDRAVGERVGCSGSTVRAIRRGFGLAPSRCRTDYRWTEADDERVIKEYPRCRSVRELVRELARELGVTVAALRMRASQLGVSKQRGKGNSHAG